MKEWHKLILQRLILELVKDLDPKPLLRYLYHKEIIDADDKEEIRSKKVRKEMSEALIDTLMNKGPEAFPELVEGLQKEQPFLACLLLKEENKRLESELEKLKTEIEELKNESQHFEEIKRLQNNRVAELETTLEEVKIQRDLAESEKSEQSIKCEQLETQTKELKTKLQSSELEVNKLNLPSCENLKATLQPLRTALPDTNLENSSQLDQRNHTLEENKRLLELEIEVQNLKIQTEELKTKLQSSEENKRLQDNQVAELETKLAEVKTLRDLVEQEKSKQSIKCEVLETQTKELQTKLQSSELKVNKLLHKCENLEAQLQLLRTALHDANLPQNSSQLDQRNNTLYGRLSGLESSKDDFEEPFDHSSGRQSRRVECKRNSRCQKRRASTRLRNEFSQTKEIHFMYEGDFDTKGVIHYLGFNAGDSMWLNPARVPSSGVKVTYGDGNGRGDPENILEYFTPVNSSSRSGWFLDLGDYYTLQLTDYTLRQLGSNDRNFLQNFELLGRLCNDDNWCLLGRHHQVDWRSQGFAHTMSGNKDLPYKTKTWSVKGEVRAYRQFKIVQIKDMSTSVPGTHAMSLAGIELYGVLSVPYLD